MRYRTFLLLLPYRICLFFLLSWGLCKLLLWMPWRRYKSYTWLETALKANEVESLSVFTDLEEIKVVLKAQKSRYFVKASSQWTAALISRFPEIKVRSGGISIKSILVAWVPVYSFFICLLSTGLVIAVIHSAYVTTVTAPPSKVATSQTMSIPTKRVEGFSSIAGYEEEKQELLDILDYLKEPKRFKALGATLPKGILLSGPPGTGKTMFAKAMAAEAGVPFFYMSGSEFVEVFVGKGAKRMRSLFARARKATPCIIFIDELDAVGGSRGNGGGHSEQTHTLNQLLTEMDGFKENQSVLLIGATNRPETLDPALTRSGRFDRKVEIGLPDARARLAILNHHASRFPLSDKVDLKEWIGLTLGDSGAELANLLNEAALIAVSHSRTQIEPEDLSEAYHRTHMGLSKADWSEDKPKELTLTAYHEAGHTIVAKLTKIQVPFVTILPRVSGSLGHTLIQFPTESYVDLSVKELESRILTLYGGRAAEEVIYGPNAVTTGASSDFSVASNMLELYLYSLGQSNILKNTLFSDSPKALSSKHSKKMMVSIQEEKASLSKSMYEQSKTMLIQNRDILEAMKEALLERETLNQKEIDCLMARQPLPLRVDANASNKAQWVEAVEENLTPTPPPEVASI